MYEMQKDKSGKIFVKGVAEAVVDCDRMDIVLSFVASEMTAPKAIGSALKQSEDFLSTIKNAGINLKNIVLDDDEIQKSGYNDDKEIRVSRTLKIDMGINIGFINFIMQQVQSKHWDVRMRIHYYLSNETEISESLQEKAVENARRRAERIAAVVGKEVVELDHIDADEVERSCARASCDEDDEFEISLESLSRELSVHTEELRESINTWWKIK